MYQLSPTVKTLREKFKIQRFRPWHNMKVGGSSPVSDYVGLWVNMQRTWSPPWFLILSFVLERCSVPECSWGVPAAPAWPPPLPARVRGFPGASGVSVGQHQVSLDLEFWHFRSITLSTLQPPNLENMPPEFFFTKLVILKNRRTTLISTLYPFWGR